MTAEETDQKEASGSTGSVAVMDGRGVDPASLYSYLTRTLGQGNFTLEMKQDVYYIKTDNAADLEKLRERRQ